MLCLPYSLPLRGSLSPTDPSLQDPPSSLQADRYIRHFRGTWDPTCVFMMFFGGVFVAAVVCHLDYDECEMHICAEYHTVWLEVSILKDTSSLDTIRDWASLKDWLEEIKV